MSCSYTIISRPGRICTLLDTTYRVISADAGAVYVMLEADGGVPCRFELRPDGALFVPDLAPLTGGPVWERRVARD